MAVASLLISCNEHHDIAAAHTTAEIPDTYFVSRVPPPHVETTLLLSIPFLCGHSCEPRFSLKAWEEEGRSNNYQHPVHVAFNGTKISKNGFHPFSQVLVGEFTLYQNCH